MIDYSTLTPDISALCRQAMLDEEPYDLQEIPHHGTTYEIEKYTGEEEYCLWLATYVYSHQLS